MDDLVKIVVAAIGMTLSAASGADDYVLGPDSMVKPGVPQGRVEALALPTSKVFPGAEHGCEVYIPAQYVAGKAACLMVFQDGGGYAKLDGAWRVPTVFDNLIHAGEMPVTIGVFVNPGVVPALSENALPRFNRTFEYDSLGDRYARFLLEEVVPEVKKQWTVSDDPSDRAIGGASSGAVCSFTVAWERPDAFRRVFSTIGTYVGLRGADAYPTLIRKCEPKPLRVFLQDGTGDLNIYGGDWYTANVDMQKALEFSGYEVSHVWGDGAHNSKHGGAIMPEGLRWLWKDHGKAPLKPNVNERQPVQRVILANENWQLVSEGHRFTEGPTAAGNGEVYFADGPNQRIHKIGLDGVVSVFAENTGGADGMCFGPDGRLYACCGKDRCVAAWDVTSGVRTVIVSDVTVNDCVVNHAGHLWFTDHKGKQVYHVAPGAAVARVVHQGGMAFPNGIELSPDQSLLYVADTQGRFVWSWQVGADGGLGHGQPYYHMHQLDESMGSGADGLALDRDGWLYVCTKAGIQICDQAGRVNGILSLPPNQKASNLTFGGAGFSTLFVTAGEQVWKRQTKAIGVRSAGEPFKPKAPRL